MTLCACSCRACLCLCCMRARACPGICHGDNRDGWKDRRVEAEIREKGGSSQVDTSSLVLSPLVVLEDCRGFVDSGSSLGPCMTPKVRFLDGVVCVLLLRGA